MKLITVVHEEVMMYWLAFILVIYVDLLDIDKWIVNLSESLHKIEFNLELKLPIDHAEAKVWLFGSDNEIILDVTYKLDRTSEFLSVQKQFAKATIEICSSIF